MLNFLVLQVYNFLAWLIALFPESTGFPSSFQSAFDALGAYLHILDPLVPISILLTCISAIVAVELALLAFRFLRWLLSYVPWIGGS